MSDLVRVLQHVRSDFPIGRPLIARPGIYECMRNSQGAVSVLVDGEWLGVKPGEFEEIETKRLHMKDLTVNEHQSLMKEIADSLRWRPMRTAPKDGTVIELLFQYGVNECSEISKWDDQDGWMETDPDATPLRWRPAHPEWGEEG